MITYLMFVYKWNQTNFSQTKTAGITALGYDHTQLLGNTLADIAWQKSGIIKMGCHVFTSPQPSECKEMLLSRAAEKKV